MMLNSWMTIASIGTVAVTMIIFGIFMLVASNLTTMAGNLESQVEMSVYLQDEITSEEVSVLGQQLMELDGVASVVYVSKEEGLQRLKEWYGENNDFLAGLEMDNPLRNAFELRTEQPEQVLDVAPIIETYNGVAEVVYGRGVVEQLFSLTRLVRLIAIGLMLGLASAATFIIANTIRITVFARRREINIMKYVGATDWFIRWPFVIEGMVLGFIGSLISAGLVSWLYGLAVTNLQVSMPFLPLVKPWPVLLVMSGWLLLLGMTIGVLGSALSLRRFLKV